MPAEGPIRTIVQYNTLHPSGQWQYIEEGIPCIQYMDLPPSADSDSILLLLLLYRVAQKYKYFHGRFRKI